MKGKFTVKRIVTRSKRSYIEVHYNGFMDSANDRIRLYEDKYVWTSNVGEATSLIVFLTAFEYELYKRWNTFKVWTPQRIVRRYLKALEAIHCNLDIRAKAMQDALDPVEWICERFISSYEFDYGKADEHCAKFIEDLKQNPRVQKTKNHKIDDEFDAKNKTFELGYNKAETYYTMTVQEVLNKKMDRMKELLDNMNAIVDGDNKRKSNGTDVMMESFKIRRMELRYDYDDMFDNYVGRLATEDVLQEIKRDFDVIVSKYLEEPLNYELEYNKDRTNINFITKDDRTEYLINFIF